MNATSSDLKIIGIDTSRPPRVRKEAYIDLYFKLSQEAPPGWGDEFNALARRITPAPKLDKAFTDCIQTYVKDMSLIAQHLLDLQKTVLACNQLFNEKLEAKAKALAERNASLQGQDGEQFKLNQIIEALDFSS